MIDGAVEVTESDLYAKPAQNGFFHTIILNVGILKLLLVFSFFTNILRLPLPWVTCIKESQSEEVTVNGN